MFNVLIGSSALNAISLAMGAYESMTCVSFQQRTNEEDYVQFFEGDGSVCIILHL